MNEWINEWVLSAKITTGSLSQVYVSVWAFSEITQGRPHVPGDVSRNSRNVLHLQKENVPVSSHETLQLFRFLRYCKYVERSIFHNRQIWVSRITFRGFEKQAPGTRFSKVPKTFQARKAICEPDNRLFRKADPFTCFQGNKKQTDCEN